MPESLKELNEICQKPNYKTVGNWMVRHLIRNAALPITWLLLHTKVSANQVTLASMIVAVIGTICFAGISRWFFLLGTILIQLWYLLDHVDGQIARYRKTASLSGRFFDFITHHVIHGCVFFGLAMYCFRTTGAFFFVLWGFIASTSITVFNLIHDTKYKTFFERLVQAKRVAIKEQLNAQESCDANEYHMLRQAFSWIHKACEVHVVMNTLTLAVVLEITLGLPIGLRFWLFLVYGTFAPFLAITRVTYLIKTRSIDHEYESLFHES